MDVPAGHRRRGRIVARTSQCGVGSWGQLFERREYERVPKLPVVTAPCRSSSHLYRSMFWPSTTEMKVKVPLSRKIWPASCTLMRRGCYRAHLYRSWTLERQHARAGTAGLPNGSASRVAVSAPDRRRATSCRRRLSDLCRATGWQYFLAHVGRHCPRKLCLPGRFGTMAHPQVLLLS